MASFEYKFDCICSLQLVNLTSLDAVTGRVLQMPTDVTITQIVMTGQMRKVVSLIVLYGNTVKRV
jgi:hypothetical protein